MCKTLFVGLQSLWLLLVLLLLAACGDVRTAVTPSGKSEVDDYNFIAAAQNLREGRYDDAITSLLLVDKRYNCAPETDLLLGVLYLDHKKDFINAMYFLKKSQTQSENVGQKSIAEQSINTAKKEFLKTFPSYTIPAPTEHELIEISNSLRAQNLTLKEELASCRKKIAEYESKLNYLKNANQAMHSQSLQNDRPKDIDQEKIIHTVVKGDTLTKISKKYYNTEKFAKKIFDANSSSLKNPKNLKIGQKLVIP